MKSSKSATVLLLLSVTASSFGQIVYNGDFSILNSVNQYEGPDGWSRGSEYNLAYSYFTPGESINPSGLVPGFAPGDVRWGGEWSQSITLPSAGTYLLSFDYAFSKSAYGLGNPLGKNSLEIMWNNVPIASLSERATIGNFTLNSFVTTSTNGVTGVLGFRTFAYNSETEGAGVTSTIDNVVVSQPVPEPATLAALGLGALGLLRRRRLARS